MNFSPLKTVALRVAPWVIGTTILLGSTMVFPHMAYNYANSKSIIIQIGLALVILLALIAVPGRSFMALMRSRVTQALGAVSLVGILASIVSIDPTLSWFSHAERGAGMFFILLTIFGGLAAALLARETETIRSAILWPIAIAGSVIAFSTILGYTGLDVSKAIVLSDVSYGGGLTGNSSFAGTYLMISFFVLAYLFATSGRVGQRVVLALLGLVTIANPVLVGFYRIGREGFGGIGSLLGDARGAAVSIVIGLLVAFGVYLAYQAKPWIARAGKTLAVGTVSVVVVLLILVCVPHNPIHDSFQKSASGTRFLFWNMSMRSVGDHPLLGTGPETYRYAHEKYFDSNLMRTTYKREVYADKPHNAYVEILATQGVVGFAAYVFFIGSLIAAFWKLGRDEKNRGAVALASGLLLAYLVNNFVIFDINLSYFLFFLLVGIAAVATGQAEEGDREVSGPVRWGMTVAGIGVLVLTLFIVIPQGTKLVRVLSEMYAPLEERSALYARSENTSRYGSIVSFAQRADVYSQNYLNHIPDILASGEVSKKLVLEDIDALKVQLETMMGRFHPDAQASLAYGRLGSAKIAILNRADPAGLKMMYDAGNQVIALSPTNPQGYWLLGQAYAYEGKFEEALEQFQKALGINPRVPESHQSVIGIANLMKDQRLVEQATAAYERDVLPEDRP